MRAARLEHMLGHMVRLRPDGSQLTWRVATMSKFDEAGRAPKPFFITWDDPALRPDKVRRVVVRCADACMAGACGTSLGAGRRQHGTAASAALDRCPCLIGRGAASCCVYQHRAGRQTVRHSTEHGN